MGIAEDSVQRRLTLGEFLDFWGMNGFHWLHFITCLIHVEVNFDPRPAQVMTITSAIESVYGHPFGSTMVKVLKYWLNSVDQTVWCTIILIDSTPSRSIPSWQAY